MDNELTVEKVVMLAARAAHETNRAYCDALGDTSQKEWNKSDKWQRDSAVLGVEQIMNNPSTTPEQSHNGWLRVKEADGWEYGPKKDAKKKEHPCFVPYSDLPEEQRVKDLLFGAVVRGVLSYYGMLPAESA